MRPGLGLRPDQAFRLTGAIADEVGARIFYDFVDAGGFFTPEYADVYGVPFQFIPTVAKTRDLTPKQTRRYRVFTKKSRK